MASSRQNPSCVTFFPYFNNGLNNDVQSLEFFLIIINKPLFLLFQNLVLDLFW